MKLLPRKIAALETQDETAPAEQKFETMMPNPEEMENQADAPAGELATSEVGTDSEEEPMMDLREEMVPPTEVDAIQSEDADEPDQPVEIVNQIPVTEQPTFSPEKSTTPEKSAHISVASLEALEASFTKARSMPREQLDEALPELLAEFTRTRSSIGDDAPEATPIDQRIEWLNIRIETRDARRAIAQTLAQADEQQISLNSKIEQWNSSRVYNLVGRMTLSSVYTGEHLPLMYRIRTIDPVTGDREHRGVHRAQTRSGPPQVPRLHRRRHR